MTKININVLYNNKIFKKFIISERNYTEKGQRALEKKAKESQKQNNPYDWRFVYKKGNTNLEYQVDFETCGILHLYTISSSYISEFPEYKVPSIKYVVKDVFDKVIAFMKRAGSVILICSIIIWFLLSFSFEREKRWMFKLPML